MGMVRQTAALIFFFSSRRRHTRCLSDWSSDVSLPICIATDLFSHRVEDRPQAVIEQVGGDTAGVVPILAPAEIALGAERALRSRAQPAQPVDIRSEERRVGKECSSEWFQLS